MRRHYRGSDDLRRTRALMRTLGHGHGHGLDLGRLTPAPDQEGHHS
ncbi:hypothetical protein ACFWP5_33080 [Streptomyces sp. NPDC058469]